MSPHATSVRHSVKELESLIKKTAKQLLGAPFWDVRFIARLQAGLKPDKLDQRVLVISKFRLFFLSEKHQKVHVEASYHLLAIKRIELGSSDSFQLTLDGRTLHFACSDVSAESIVETILLSVKHYFPEASSHHLFHAQPPSLHELYASQPEGRPALPCGHFRRTYAALCDYFKVSYREEIVWDIEKIYATHDNRTLRLDDFDHLQTKDLVPIVGVLQYSRWFTGLELQGKTGNIKIVGELCEVLCNVLRFSQSVNSLGLSDCGLKSDSIISICQAVAASSDLPLTQITLAGCSLDDNKVILQLSNALSQHCLSVLDLSEVEMSAKNVNALMGRLKDSQNGLTTLRLPGHAGATTKGDELTELSSLLAVNPHLTVLDLSHLPTPIDVLLPALHCSARPLLRTLRLRHATYAGGGRKKSTPGNDEQRLASIKAAASALTSLEVLDLSGAHLTAEALKHFLLGLSIRTTAPPLSLHLDSLHVDTCWSTLEACLPALECVKSLSLRDNDLLDHLPSLFPAISRLPSLGQLDLGGHNFGQPTSGKDKRGSAVGAAMVELVKLVAEEDKPLRSLCLSSARLSLTDLSPLLNAIALCPHLRSVDLSDNAMKDAGARLLAKALQINTSLRCLSLDRNGLTATGYGDIATSLQMFNHSVEEIPYPSHDIAEQHKADKKAAEKMEHTFRDVEAWLIRNRQRGRDTSEAVERQVRVLAANLDEELRRAVYAAERTLQYSSVEGEDGRRTALGNMLGDAEKARHLVRDLQSVCRSDDFIDALARNWRENLEKDFLAARKDNITAMSKAVGDAQFECINDEVRASVLEAIGSARLAEEVDAGETMQLAVSRLKVAYGSNNVSLIASVAERIVHNLVAELVQATRELSAISADGSLRTNSLASLSGSTGGKESPLLHHRSRNASGRTFDRHRPRPSSNDSQRSKKSNPVLDGEGTGDGKDLDTSETASMPLRHHGKERPRAARKNRVQRVMPATVDEGEVTMNGDCRTGSVGSPPSSPTHNGTAPPSLPSPTRPMSPQQPQVSQEQLGRLLQGLKPSEALKPPTSSDALKPPTAATNLSTPKHADPLLSPSTTPRPPPNTPATPAVGMKDSSVAPPRPPKPQLPTEPRRETSQLDPELLSALQVIADPEGTDSSGGVTPDSDGERKPPPRPAPPKFVPPPPPADPPLKLREKDPNAASNSDAANRRSVMEMSRMFEDTPVAATAPAKPAPVPKPAPRTHHKPGPTTKK